MRLEDRLDELARQHEPPQEWLEAVDRRRRSRQVRRRVGAVAAAVVLMGIAIVPIARWTRAPTDTRQPAGSPQPTPVTSWQELFEVSFDEPTAAIAWPPDESGPRYVLTHDRGGYVMAISEAFHDRYWVLTGTVQIDTIQVEASVRTLPKTALPEEIEDEYANDPSGGFQGVMCASASDPVDAYIMAFDPTDGDWVIQRIDDERSAITLAQGSFELTAGSGPWHTITGTCERGSNGSEAHLTIDVDGQHATTIDHHPHSGFRGPGIYLATRGEPAAVAFDHVLLRVPD